ncbi:MAG: DMT family transporter [Comamonadaceae bacterium]|nr:MAG: DMT family transporter [Comamonadaceae bacterium]
MWIAYLKMTIATVLFGSYLVASKLILEEAPAFTATLIRLLSAALALGLYVMVRRPGAWRRPGARDCMVLGVQGTLGVFLFSIFAMYGVSMTGGIEAGVILSMVPVAMCFVALIFLKEAPSSRRLLGVAVSVAGAIGINAMAARTAGAGAHAQVVTGSLLLLCAVICEAVFLTFGKFLERPIAPERLSLILALIGAALFVVPAAMEPRGLLHASYSARTWALMIYTGLAINGLAAVLMYDSLDRVDTVVASAFTALTPVSGTLLSMLFLGEALHGYHVSGMVLVVVGVFVVASDRRSRGEASDPPPLAGRPVRG